MQSYPFYLQNNARNAIIPSLYLKMGMISLVSVSLPAQLETVDCLHQLFTKIDGIALTNKDDAVEGVADDEDRK